VLALGQVEEGDDPGLLVIGRILGQDLIDELVILVGEVEVSLLGVVGRVDVLCARKWNRSAMGRILC
jgi:hypothetical protein